MKNKKDRVLVIRIEDGVYEELSVQAQNISSRTGKRFTVSKLVRQYISQGLALEQSKIDYEAARIRRVEEIQVAKDIE